MTSTKDTLHKTIEISVRGAVQGIGYRPFVAALAEKYGIAGWVINAAGIVEITAAGPAKSLDDFVRGLKDEAPAGSHVGLVTVRPADAPWTEEGFTIRVSRDAEASPDQRFPWFLPDLGICPDCLREMDDPVDRRSGYPLISCTACGPRYSILRRFPYDRESITMEAFPMCPQCGREYVRIGDRRRHAQTISCHDCGPQMKLRIFDTAHLGASEDSKAPKALKDSRTELKGEAAAEAAADILRNGGILALKGLGGYQLLASPFIEDAVRRLREVKGREAKPFAVMFENVHKIREYAQVSSAEEAELTGSARPIVLTKIKEKLPFSDLVCGESSYLGAFLPSQGVHLQLVRAAGPLIVTSANRSGQPIPIRDDVMMAEGGALADALYYHDREILRPLDDSVLRMDGEDTVFIRRSRGYVPEPILLRAAGSFDGDVLAVGADLKNTAAILRGDQVILTQYYGDMEELSVQENAEAGIRDLMALYGARPARIICDLHPRYASSQLAKRLARELHAELIQVQHHHAHIASVMAEHGLGRCLGLAFDGVGYGTDGQLWGGEFLLCEEAQMERVGSLKHVTLVGGDRASIESARVEDCYRYALGLPLKDARLAPVLESGFGGIRSSSAGRLIDATASALGISTINRYEGDSAEKLMAAALRAESMESEKERALRQAQELEMGRGLVTDDLQLDAPGLIREMIRRQAAGEDPEKTALLFHGAFSAAAAFLAAKIAGRYDLSEVALSGGVFVNPLIRSRIPELLRKEGLGVYLNVRVPSGDGGLSLGQAYLGGL